MLDHSTQTAITSLRSLSILNLARTRMSDLPENFLNGIKNLLKLDLSFNKFDVVPRETENAETLVELNIDGNLMKVYFEMSYEKAVHTRLCCKGKYHLAAGIQFN